jgi:hypothetical protein
MRQMSRLFRANFSEKAHFRQLWIVRCAPVQSGLLCDQRRHRHAACHHHRHQRPCRCHPWHLRCRHHWQRYCQMLWIGLSAHAATFSSLPSTSSPFLNSAPALTSATR